MSEAPMDRARLCAILDAYGADAKRWPAGERAAAEALAAALQDEISEHLAAARALDAALGEAAIVVDEITQARMITKAQATFAAARTARPLSAGAFAALAACLVLGFALGYADGARTNPLDEADFIEVAFGLPDGDGGGQ
jgi:hypothetical protein